MAGCSEQPTGTVAGVITLDEKPLETASITFLDVYDRRPVGYAKVTNGEFALAEPLPVGQYFVAVIPPEEEAPAGTDDEARAKQLAAVPQQYWSHATSGLSAEVLEGPNDLLSFELPK